MFQTLLKKRSKCLKTGNGSVGAICEKYKVYKLAGPQRQGIESCRILSRPGSVKHLKLKKYTERLILTAVKERHRRRNT